MIGYISSFIAYVGGNMQITWLFGNGLDISLGLKTRYTDFYKYLLSNEDKINLSKNIIFEKLKKDFEEGKDYLWADYEKQLGDLLKIVNEEQKDQFIQDKVQLDLRLREYLLDASENFQISKEEAKDIIMNALLEITRDKKEVEKAKIRKLLNTHANEDILINAISFNYTKAISMMWDNNLQSMINLKFFGKFPFAGHSVILNEVFYLHGTLNNGEMIVGVNDVNQLTNDKLQNDNRVNMALVKKELLEIAGQMNIAKFLKMINASKIICLFGLSVGETDIMYWEYIKKRLLADNEVKLIIFEYRDKNEPTHIILDEMKTLEVKSKIYKNSNATKDEITKIENNILVEIGHELFKISK